MRFDEALLTAADVHDQAERERHVDAASEEGDLLRHAVFSDLEVLLLQIGDEVSFIVADGEPYVDQADIDADGRARLRAADQSSGERGQANHHRHSHNDSIRPLEAVRCANLSKSI